MEFVDQLPGVADGQVSPAALQEGFEPSAGIVGGDAGGGDDVTDGGAAFQASQGREDVGLRLGERQAAHVSPRASST